MPTENQSSNTEMVSDMLPPCADDVFKNGVSACLVGDVPKHAAETTCQSLSAITGWKIDWHYIGGRTHIKALAPAEQHQGEPVAYLCKAEGAKWLQYGSRVGDPWKPGEVQVTPLYTHADPGEVERLAILLRQTQVKHSQVVDGLRADSKWLRDELDKALLQLAEREALLVPIAGWTAETRATVLEAFQDELNESASYPWYDAAIADLMKLIEALSASSEPSAPVEVDHDALVAAVCVLRSQGLGNLSAAVEEARAALERKPS